MKHERIISPSILLLAALLLNGCAGGIGARERTSAEDRLHSMMERVPAPPGAVLIKTANTSLSGQMSECQGSMMQVFYGTNELSFQQVMDFYTASLQAQGWDVQSVHSFATTFRLGDEFTADVSDRVDVSSVGRDVVQQGKNNYRTVFLFDLYTSIIVPAPPKCREG